MERLLKPDKISNGLITGLIEKYWNYLENDIAYNMDSEILKQIHSVLVQYENNKNEYNDFFFDWIPKHIYIPFDKKVSTENAKKEYFEAKGIVVYDGIYPSAFGRFNYIYRCKGQRIIWLENGNIVVLSHFSHIDERGFQFDNIEIDRINFFNGEYEDLYPYIDDGGRTIHFSDRTNILTFLYLLTHIKQNYEKSYHLEYLLDFPNVDRVSNFSTIVRFEIWESIIDFVKRTLLEDFTDKYLDFIDYLFETTWLLDINPGSSDVYSLMKFILENKNRINDNNLNSIMRILQRIDANVDRIDNNLDTAKNEINQKLDNISDGLAETKKILFDFKNMFAEYQKDISEKLSNPLLDEISREKLEVERILKKILMMFNQ